MYLEEGGHRLYKKQARTGWAIRSSFFAVQSLCRSAMFWGNVFLGFVISMAFIWLNWLIGDQSSLLTPGLKLIIMACLEWFLLSLKPAGCGCNSTLKLTRLLSLMSDSVSRWVSYQAHKEKLENYLCEVMPLCWLRLSVLRPRTIRWM